MKEIHDILKDNDFKTSNIDWSKFIEEVAEKVTPAEVKAYAEGYLEALEAIYHWLIKEPGIKTSILVELKEFINIIGGDLYGEE